MLGTENTPWFKQIHSLNYGIKEDEVAKVISSYLVLCADDSKITCHSLVYVLPFLISRSLLPFAPLPLLCLLLSQGRTEVSSVQSPE